MLTNRKLEEKWKRINEYLRRYNAEILPKVEEIYQKLSNPEPRLTEFTYLYRCNHGKPSLESRDNPLEVAEKYVKKYKNVLIAIVFFAYSRMIRDPEEGINYSYLGFSLDPLEAKKFSRSEDEVVIRISVAPNEYVSLKEFVEAIEQGNLEKLKGKFFPLFSVFENIEYSEDTVTLNLGSRKIKASRKEVESVIKYEEFTSVIEIGKRVAKTEKEVIYLGKELQRKTEIYDVPLDFYV